MLLVGKEKVFLISKTVKNTSYLGNFLTVNQGSKDTANLFKTVKMKKREQFCINIKHKSEDTVLTTQHFTRPDTS